MKKPASMRYRVTFYRDGKRVCSSIQTALNSAMAGFMAEQQLIDLCPGAVYDYYDVQFAV